MILGQLQLRRTVITDVSRIGCVAPCILLVTTRQFFKQDVVVLLSHEYGNAFVCR